MLVTVSALRRDVPVVTPYVAHGVQFNSAVLTLASLPCTDNGYFAQSMWLYGQFNSFDGSVWAVDYSATPQNNMTGTGTGALQIALDNATNSQFVGVTFGNTLGVRANAWNHILYAGYGNVTTPKPNVLYVNDVLMSPDNAFLVHFHSSGAFIPALNGKQLIIGDDGFSDFWTGAMADVSMWPGFNLLSGTDIDVSVRRLFIDGSGNPVDPAVAIAALGTPPVLLSGNAASFASNSLGSAGAFTLSTGTLTNAASNPP